MKRRNVIFKLGVANRKKAQLRVYLSLVIPPPMIPSKPNVSDYNPLHMHVARYFPSGSGV